MTDFHKSLDRALAATRKRRLKLLDLFCCLGGASEGYRRAGFDVYGVDLFEDYTQKRYPFLSHKGDALEAVSHLLDGHRILFEPYPSMTLTLRDFDVVVASPPCQKYSITNAARKADYPDLIGPTREALRATGLPYVIENVVGAPLESPVELCWTGFNEPGSVLDDDGTPLQMFRHRLFESNIPLTSPGCNHAKGVQVAGSYGGARRDKREAREVRHGGYVPSIPVQQQLLGIDWMTQKGMHQSIPPCFTEAVGRQLLAHIDNLRDEVA